MFKTDMEKSLFSSYLVRIQQLNKAFAPMLVKNLYFGSQEYVKAQSIGRNRISK